MISAVEPCSDNLLFVNPPANFSFKGTGRRGRAVKVCHAGKTATRYYAVMNVLLEEYMLVS